MQKKITYQRLISFALTVIMLFGLMPALSLTASAEQYGDYEYIITNSDVTQQYSTADYGVVLCSTVDPYDATPVYVYVGGQLGIVTRIFNATPQKEENIVVVSVNGNTPTPENLIEGTYLRLIKLSSGAYTVQTSGVEGDDVIVNPNFVQSPADEYYSGWKAYMDMGPIDDCWRSLVINGSVIDLNPTLAITSFIRETSVTNELLYGRAVLNGATKIILFGAEPIEDIDGIDKVHARLITLTQLKDLLARESDALFNPVFVAKKPVVGNANVLFVSIDDAVAPVSIVVPQRYGIVADPNSGNIVTPTVGVTYTASSPEAAELLDSNNFYTTKAFVYDSTGKLIQENICSSVMSVVNTAGGFVRLRGDYITQIINDTFFTNFYLVDELDTTLKGTSYINNPVDYPVINGAGRFDNVDKTNPAKNDKFFYAGPFDTTYGVCVSKIAGEVNSYVADTSITINGRTIAFKANQNQYRFFVNYDNKSKLTSVAPDTDIKGIRGLSQDEWGKVAGNVNAVAYVDESTGSLLALTIIVSRDNATTHNGDVSVSGSAWDWASPVQLQLYRLTVTAEAGGTITMGASGNYASGARFSITAIANTGYRFVKWTSSDGGIFGDAYSPSTTFTMPTNATTIIANFEPTPPNTYAITTSAGTGGNVAGSGNYTSGTTVTLAATANSGYTFEGWYENNIKIAGAGATYTFTVSANRTLEARFIANPPAQYSLTVKTGTGGIVSNANGNYESSAIINITATADTGYRFVKWTSSNGGIFGDATSAITTFTMPDNETTVTAIFEPIPATTYSVTATAGTGGAVTGNGTFISGSAVTLTATPDSGYTFEGWYENNIKIDEASEIYIFIVTDNRNFEARFIYNTEDNADDAESGIDYTQPPTVINGSSNGFQINLTNETLEIPGPYPVRAYSTNGGDKWVIVKPDTFSNAKFAKLLDKGMILCLSYYDIDPKTKKPPIDSIITFQKINKRPAAPKVEVNYVIGADMTGVTAGDWVLVEKGTETMVKNGIEIAASNTSGKTPGDYGRFYDGGTNGIPVKEFAGKVEKTVYFARYASKYESDGTYTPASKTVKLNVSSQGKLPAYKADYKKEVIKLKKGDMIYAGPVNALDSAEVVVVSETQGTIEAGQLIYVTSAKGATISLADYLTTAETTIVIWNVGTAKTPSTGKQVYTLAARAELTDRSVDIVKGKAALPKIYEVYNNNKWGGMPIVKSSAELPVRLKSTAKATGATDKGYAASAEGTLMIECDDAGILVSADIMNTPPQVVAYTQSFDDVYDESADDGYFESDYVDEQNY